MANDITIEQVRQEVLRTKWRSKWNNGVTIYACELLDDLNIISSKKIEADPFYSIANSECILLCGSKDWYE